MKLDKRDILHLACSVLIGLLVGTSFSLLVSIKRDTALILNAQEKEEETTTQETEPVTEEVSTEEVTEVEEETTTEEETTEPTPSIYSVFTPEEIYLIQRCVETETYQQDLASKINVACVIFNRYENGRFAKTITGIITGYKQFAYHRTEISESTIEAVEKAWEYGDTTNGALYFHSNPKTDTFNGASYLFTDRCGHHFYR